MNKFPETIIEIYDDEQIYNILSIVKFKPKNVVYIGTRKLKNKRVKNNLISCLRSLGIDTRCYFYATDMHSINKVTAELENILSIYGDVAIDLTGGSEVALVAVGMIAKEKGIPLFRYDRYTKCYRDIYCCSEAEGVSADFKFNINAFLALSGSAVKSHGHISLDGLDGETAEDILKVWDIYTSYYREWHRTVAYLQQISKSLYADELQISGKQILFGEEIITSADGRVMSALCDAGIIRNYKKTSKSVSFSYKNRLMKSCLTDIGICLELYVYAMILESGIFDDVMISVVIDWDGKFDEQINTINEIDVVATKGAVPLFISCKSGTPSVTALNEIKMLTGQFGGVSAKSVLVTMSDVKEKDRYFAQRAEDMDVAVIGREELLSGGLVKRLVSISKM